MVSAKPIAVEEVTDPEILKSIEVSPAPAGPLPQGLTTSEGATIPFGQLEEVTDPDIIEFADRSARVSEMGALARGASSATNALKGIFGAATSAAGDALDWRTLQDWGAELHDKYSAIASQYAGETPSAEDVLKSDEFFTDFMSWAGFNLASGGITALPGLAARAMPGPAGAATGLAMLYGMGVGEIYGGQLDNAEDPNAKLAFAGAIPYAVSEYAFGAGARLGRALTKTAQKDVAKKFLTRMLKEVPAGAASEITAEASQTAIQEAIARIEGGEELRDIFSDTDFWKAIGEGAAAGAVPGAGFGAVSAIPGPRKELPRVPPPEDEQPSEAPEPSPAPPGAEPAATGAGTRTQPTATGAPAPTPPVAVEPVPDDEVVSIDEDSGISAVGPAYDEEEAPELPQEAPTEAAAPPPSPEAQEIAAAASEAEIEPTDAQKEAGNYKKAHVKVQGLDVTIENPKGSVRRGTDRDGNEWETTLPAHYGYIKRTEGADGDQVDVYVGDNPEADRAYVIDQIDPETQEFDEHKVILGATTDQAAENLYNDAFSDGSGPLRMGNFRRMSIDEFKGWLRDGDQTAPVAESQPAAPSLEETAPSLEETAVTTPPATTSVSQEEPQRPTIATSQGIVEVPADELVTADDGGQFRVFQQNDGKYWVETIPSPPGSQPLGPFDTREAAAATITEEEPSPPAPVVEPVESEEEPAPTEPQREEEAAPEPVADRETVRRPAKYGTTNKVFTADDAEKARALLRSKMNQLSAGIDPELMQAGITLAGYHIEAGARSFAAYSKAMIEDLGEGIRPYLRGFYENVRYYPGFDTEGMTPADQIGAETTEEAAEPEVRDVPDHLYNKKTWIARQFSEAFKQGRSFRSIVEARKFARAAINNAEISNKEIEEAIELGVVSRAQEIAEQGGLNEEEVYNQLVLLYQAQPKLSDRTSTSVEQQAYSTPAPLAYLVAQRAGIDNKTSVYEPAAGNGMLLITANSQDVHANEINPDRAESLEYLGNDYREVTTEDATTYSPPGKFDAVVMNPPFGKIRGDKGPKTFDLDGLSTKEADQAIAWRALKSMKDNGKAVIIMGSQKGGADARTKAYRGQKNIFFFKKLYDTYNVVDHFTVSGDLYARQGAEWPVDVIIIDGKGASSLALPSGVTPPVLSSWEEIRSKFDADSVDAAQQQGRAGEREAGEPAGEGAEPAAVPSRPRAQDRQDGEQGEPTRGAKATRGDRERGAGTEGRKGPADRGRAAGGELGVAAQPGEVPGRAGPGAAGERAGDIEGAERGKARGFSEPAVPRQRVERENLEVETEHQVKYKPHSRAKFAVGTLVPKNMQQALDKALNILKNRVGDIDTYVAEKLDYDMDDMLGTDERPGYFSAEQVDALALAITNIDTGGGFIIGDQTGVGKGRIVAGALRYAALQGKTPVFVTKDPGLYGDMVRDFRGIGMPEVVGQILMTNNGLSKGKAVPISDEEGDVIAGLPGDQPTKMMNEIIKTGTLPDDYQFFFTNYSQMQFIGDTENDRQKALRALAPNAIIVMDESHLAGGSAKPSVDALGKPKPTRADFFREILGMTPAALYSSATYAKSPNVMSLYFKTDLSLAVDKVEDLGPTIEAGGVPLQQVVANMLVEGGQYARRERSFDGVEMNLDTMETDTDLADRASGSLRQIFSLDTDFMEVVREAFAEKLAATGALAGKDTAVGEMSITSTGFANIMHNVVSQMLLSLKADGVIDKAIELHKAGEKPIIALSNTNESILDDLIKEEGLAEGDPVQLGFDTILKRYLRRLRRVTIKHGDKESDKEHVYMSDDDLRELGGEATLQAYREAEKAIEAAALSHMPASPVDYILDRLADAGIKAGEITGRQQIIKKGRLAKRKAGPSEKKKAMNAYNAGRLDALVINRSGSTGYSMHATAEDGNDGKQRHMIILQPEANIDDFMQMLGRIHRTGQIKLPKYTIASTDLAVEKRVAAILMRKLGSLNANTTASKRSAVSLDNVTDFLNKYGDEIVVDFLRDETEIRNVLNIKPKPTMSENDGISSKFTGRLAMLPGEQVAEIYDRVEAAYNDYIESLDRMGINTLEAKTFELDARTEKTEMLREGQPGLTSPFAEPAYLETVNIKKQGKPYTPEQLDAEVAKVIGDQSAQEYVNERVDSLNSKLAAFKEKIEQKKADLRERLGEAKTEKQKEKITGSIVSWETQGDEAAGKLRDIINMIRLLEPGEALTFSDESGETSIRLSAVSLGVDIRAAGESPLAASSMKIRMAIGDAGREVHLPLSKFIGKDAPYRLTRADPSRTRAAFEEGQSETRETRQIITGNIVSGFSKFKKGQIIVFTDSDGAVRQGILMPKDFNAKAELEKQPAKFKTGEQIAKFLTTAERGTRMVTSEDGTLGITYQRGEFQAQVKRRGGKMYYLLQPVRSIIGDFTGRQKMMSATIGDQQKLEAVIAAYQDNLGTEFMTQQDKKAARDITGENVELSEIDEDGGKSYAVAADFTEGFAGDRNKVAARLKELVRQIAPGARLRIVDDLFRASGERKVRGSYEAAENLITVALGFSDAENALRHEAIHALREMGMFTNREWSLLEKKARNTWFEEFRIAENYPDLGLEAQLEEAIAMAFGQHRAGKQFAPGYRKAFERVVQFLRRTANMLRGYGFSTPESIFVDVMAGKVGRRQARARNTGRVSYAATGPGPDPAALEAFSRKIGRTKIPAKQKFIDFFSDRFIDRMKQGVFDDLHGLNLLERYANEGKLFEDKRSAYKLARLTRGINDVIMEAMSFGAPVWHQGTVSIDESVKAPVQIIDEVGDALLLKFEMYMAARRAQELRRPSEKYPEGRENLISPEDEAAGLALGEQYPQFAQHFADLQAYNKRLLDFVQDSGLIDQSTRAFFDEMHQNYVPFFRIMENEKGVKGPKARMGFSGQHPNFRHLTGGEQNIEHPLLNLEHNVHRLIEASIKNVVMLRTEQLNAELGEPIMTPAAKRAVKVNVSNEQMIKDLEGQGLIIEGEDGIDTRSLRALWSLGNAPQGDNIVSLVRNGKVRYYQVDDPLLFQSLTMLHRTDLPFIKYPRMAKHLLTAAVGLDPSFQLANWLRDTMHASVITHIGMKPGYNSARGLIHRVRNSQTYKEFLRSGAGMSSLFEADTPSMHARIEERLGERGAYGEIVFSTKKLIGGLQRWESTIEYSTRIGAYERAIANGATRMEAAYQAREISTDFAMRGSFTIVRALADMVPFLNAGMQGLYRTARGSGAAMGENNRRKAAMRFALKGGIVAAASVALHFMNDDDERYKALPPHQRDLYWHFTMIPWGENSYLKIPKPFEVGAIFGSIPERMAEEFADSESIELNKRMRWIFSEMFRLDIMPQILKPVVGVKFNRDEFREQPIVPFNLERLRPAEQYDERTSYLAIEMGRAANVSPKKIEFLLNGYIGAWGSYIWSASDTLFTVLGGYPEKEAIRIWERPVFRRVMQPNTIRGSKYQQEFYDMLKEVDEVQYSINRLQDLGEIDRARKLQGQNQRKLAVRKTLQNLNTQIKKRNEQIRMVQRAKHLSADEKRKRLDRLQEDKNRIFKASERMRRLAERD